MLELNGLIGDISHQNLDLTKLKPNYADLTRFQR